MRRELARAGMAAIAAVGVVAASACSSAGSGIPSGAERASVVLPEITSAVKSARSVHVTGRVSTGGRTTTINLGFAGASGMSGTMTVSGAELGLLSTNDETYIKINSAFLTLANAPTSACKLMCGKYVLVPAADAQSITGALSMSGLLNSVFGKLPHAAAGDYFVPGTYQGQAVLEFRQSGYSLIVARSSPHFPLAITAPHGEYLGFSAWNAVTVPPPPPASQTVKLGSLGS
jgi:hypothetical protein